MSRSSIGRDGNVELLFRSSNQSKLDEINTIKPYMIEALIIVTVTSLMISRVILDELHELDAKRRDAADADGSTSRLPPRRGSLAVERHTHLIQPSLIMELGYELPDLDESLLWASRNPNPHRERLRDEVESGEFASDRH